LKRRDLVETMAKNIPSGAIRFSCHIAEIHPANPGNHGAVLTTLDGSIIKAKVRPAGQQHQSRSSAVSTLLFIY
jgi:hypothetical protein